MRNWILLCALAATTSTAVLAQDANSVAAVDMNEFADFEVVPEETVTYSNRTDFNWDEFEIELDETQINWTFHTDLANRILYIDFEALGGKMSQVELKDQAERVLFNDDHLQSLPTNTIYEVSLRDLEIGDYVVLLHTLTGTIRQEIRITE